MGAPKGNQYAVGNNGGRPTKYKSEYCQEIIEYFQKEPFMIVYKGEFHKDGTLKSKLPILQANEFPTFQGFADKLGVGTSTLNDWVKEHKEFAESYARAKENQEKIWLINSMQNLYNAQFAQFFGKNCLGYKDKQEIDTNISGGIEVTFANPDLDEYAK